DLALLARAVPVPAISPRHRGHHRGLLPRLERPRGRAGSYPIPVHLSLDYEARFIDSLVLDEPTNDLDLETLDLLQERLAEYPGTVLLVSHDRDFLDRVVTSTIASEGKGRWVEYAGGYTDMLAQRRAASRGSPPAKARGVKQT